MDKPDSKSGSVMHLLLATVVQKQLRKLRKDAHGLLFGFCRIENEGLKNMGCGASKLLKKDIQAIKDSVPHTRSTFEAEKISNADSCNNGEGCILNVFSEVKTL